MRQSEAGQYQGGSGQYPQHGTAAVGRGRGAGHHSGRGRQHTGSPPHRLCAQHCGQDGLQSELQAKERGP